MRFGALRLLSATVPSPKKKIKGVASHPRQARQAHETPETPPSEALRVTAGPRLEWFCIDHEIHVSSDDSSHAHCALNRVAPTRAESRSRPKSIALEDATTFFEAQRISTGIEGFDRVLGGGLVRNGIVTIDGPPGIGKTTILSMAGGRIAHRGGHVLYASGEETAPQVAACAKRIGHVVEGVRIIHTDVLEDVFDEIKLLAEFSDFRVDVLIVDSAQAFRCASASSPTGSPHMVGAVAEALRSFCKKTGVAVILVSQVTKDGTMAGPKTMEHAVDTVIDFGMDEYEIRWLRTIKNRFGPRGVVSQFEMSPRGLVEVVDPSLVAWESLVGDPGVVGCVVAHLAKPVVVAVEALVTRDEGITAGRSVQATGFPQERLRFLIESLSRYDKELFSKCSIRVRVPVVTGQDIDDEALDLAVAAACWSSAKSRPLGRSILLGGVGLSGKMMASRRIDARIECAESARASIVISGHPKEKRFAAKIPVVSIAHVSSLVETLDHIAGAGVYA